MTDEPNLRTKTDVLDLVISFMMDHEKRMDQMIERIERIADKLSKNRGYTKHQSAPIETTEYQADKFTITIDNPENYGPMRSIKIDWDKPQQDIDLKSPDILDFLEEIEQIYRES